MFTTFTSTTVRAVVGTAGTVLCAGLCLFAATAPANAEPIGATVRSTTVSVADLNLHTARGRAALDRRLVQAARAVCASGDVSLTARIDESRCVRQAVATAKPTIG